MRFLPASQIWALWQKSIRIVGYRAQVIMLFDGIKICGVSKSRLRI
jgi:hypothetical protein